MVRKPLHNSELEAKCQELMLQLLEELPDDVGVVTVFVQRSSPGSENVVLQTNLDTDKLREVLKDAFTVANDRHQLDEFHNFSVKLPRREAHD